MNRKKWVSHILQFLTLLLLSAWPSLALAKFVIEFTDGRRMTVSNYEQTEELIKVYTTVGSFSFQRTDVAKITDIGPKKAKRSYAGAPEKAVRTPANEKISSEETHQLAENDSNRRQDSSPSQQPELRKTINSVADSPEGQTILWSLEYGIYRLRYVFALLVGIKLLKLFLAASVK